MEEDTLTKEIKSDNKLIKRFEDDWASMTDYWQKLHDRHRKDTKFTWFNDQWSQIAKDERKMVPASNGNAAVPPRPTMVYNISKPFLIKVINGVKKMRPALQVTPTDDNTDKVLADVRRGTLKAIEKNTGAVAARMEALKAAVGSGFGFYCFDTDYEDPLSFNQAIKYRTIQDATTVLWDKGNVEPNGSDVKKVIISEKYSKDNFEAEFGIKWGDVWEGGENATSMAWGGEEYPVVSDYWYVEE